MSASPPGASGSLLGGNQQLEHHQGLLAQIFDIENRISVETAAIADLEASFGVVGLIDRGRVTNLHDYALKLAGHLSLRLRRLEKWRQRLTQVSGISVAQASVAATKRREDLARVKESTRRRAGAERQSLEATFANVITHEGMLGLNSVSADHDHQDAYADGESALVLANASADRATKALATTDAALSEARAQDASLAARVADLTLRKAAYGRAFDEDRYEWGRLGFGHAQPNQVEVEDRKAALARAIARLNRTQDRILRLAQGTAAWTRMDIHHSALQRLRDASDGARDGNRDQIRAAAETFASQRRRLLEATKETKDLSRQASADILNQVADFNKDYIEPLDDLMKQINLAILCDPRVGINLQVKNKRIEQVAYKSGEVPSGEGSIDPVLVHSEGQMAALGVSMLAAASLTYPWSRWRALVLDDPLQYNDAIHASAFADLMSNIVREQQYQLLISTHDAAQAEFLRRKFDSRRIPCSMLNLLGVGQEGVEWKLRGRSADSL